MPQILFNQILDEIPELLAAFNEKERKELDRYVFSLAVRDSRNVRRTLVTEGNIADSVYFLLSGKAQCSYYSEYHRREIAPFLLPAPCILAEGKSMFKKRPARFSIDVWPGSVVYSLSSASILYVTEKYPQVDVVVKQLVKGQTQLFKSWKNELLMRTAKERYLKLSKTHPHIVNRFLKKNIAAHLAITDQSFSRLLKEINF